jgi:hypothetical protein
MIVSISITLVIATYILAVVWANLNPEQQSPDTTLTDRLFWYPAEMLFATLGPAIVPLLSVLIAAAVLWVVL